LVMYICNPSTREAEAEGKKTPNWVSSAELQNTSETFNM
jgi:hypothetical protein